MSIAIATFQDGFDPNRDRYFDRAAWTDPGPLQFGNAPSRDATARGFRNTVEDVSLFKETPFGENDSDYGSRRKAGMSRIALFSAIRTRTGAPPRSSDRRERSAISLVLSSSV